MKHLLLLCILVLSICAPAYAAPGTVTPIGPSFSFGNISTSGGKITATRPSDTVTLQGINNTITKSGKTITITGAVTTSDLTALVPKTTTVNGHALSSNVTVTASDVGALPSGTTTAGVPDSTDKRYVTDAQRTVIQNTSGTNTGDQTNVSGNAGTATALQTARTINGVSFNGTANIGQDLQTTASPTFNNLQADGTLVLQTVGKSISIKTGINAKMGSGTLVAGAATISNTSVTANSYIFLTGTGSGILANMGAIYEDKPSRVAGTSFTVKSLNALDSSTFIYFIIEPS